jgi:ceramide glucosyltransferase
MMTHTASIVASWLLFRTIAIGCALWVATLMAAFAFRLRAPARIDPRRDWPAVTLLKPVYGLEKKLRDNLRSACLQDYPRYQVLYSLQRPDDPALDLLLDLQREFGRERVTVAIEQVEVGLNGKINNLTGALPHALHDVLVISDSDVCLRADYLRTMAAALEPGVGAVSTFFRAVDADTRYERMEQLTINTEHVAVAMLAHVLGLFDFCFGASIALRRATLARVGGMASFGHYLVEDHELGRRVLAAGMRLKTLSYMVDTTIDLHSASQWWQKQTYWDQNTRAAEPVAFLATFVLRVIPLALLLCVLRGWDASSLAMLGAATLARVGAAACVVAVALRDRRALLSLWLIPIKDVLGLYWFVFAFTKRTVVWRGVKLRLTGRGRLQPLSGTDP